MTVLEITANNLATPVRAEESSRGGKLLAALLSWWRYRVRPPLRSTVPAHLRADLGLPEVPGYEKWDGVSPITFSAPLIALWRQ